MHQQGKSEPQDRKEKARVRKVANSRREAAKNKGKRGRR
jgi:hypothetical protein